MSSQIVRDFRRADVCLKWQVAIVVLGSVALPINVVSLFLLTDVGEVGALVAAIYIIASLLVGLVGVLVGVRHLYMGSKSNRSR